jgi:hypothetical protein
MPLRKKKKSCVFLVRDSRTKKTRRCHQYPKKGQNMCWIHMLMTSKNNKNDVSDAEEARLLQTSALTL